MAKSKLILILAVMFFLLISNAIAAQVISQNYKQRVVISSGGEDISSQSYKMNVAVGLLNSVVTSSSYVNHIGFFHTVLLADNQPCTFAFECEGGFCCSGRCSSSSCPTVASGGGGGGAAVGVSGGSSNLTQVQKVIVKDFSINTSSIKEKVPLQDSKLVAFKIKNTGNADLNFTLSISGVNDFVSLSENNFALEANQEKTIIANITGTRLGSYIGEIQAAAGDISNSISVVIDVESKEVLFDVKIDIPSTYKEILPGSELKAQITLLNIGPSKKVDVTPTYIIKDSHGISIFEESETFPVEKQISYLKSFKLPQNQPPGDYLAIVELRYQNSFAVSSDLFKIVVKKEVLSSIASSKSFILSLLVAVIVLIIASGYAAVSRMGGNADKSLKMCYKLLDEAEGALRRNEVPNARKIYSYARKQYARMIIEHKKEVYPRFMDLYRRLR